MTEEQPQDDRTARAPRAPARRPRRPTPDGPSRRGVLLFGAGAALLAAGFGAVALVGGGAPRGLARWKGTYTVLVSAPEGFLGKRAHLTDATFEVTGEPAAPWAAAGEGKVRLRLPGGEAESVVAWGWKGEPVRLWLEEEGGPRRLALEAVR